WMIVIGDIHGHRRRYPNEVCLVERLRRLVVDLELRVVERNLATRVRRQISPDAALPVVVEDQMTPSTFQRQGRFAERFALEKLPHTIASLASQRHVVAPEETLVLIPIGLNGEDGEHYLRLATVGARGPGGD